MFQAPLFVLNALDQLMLAEYDQEINNDVAYHHYLVMMDAKNHPKATRLRLAAESFTIAAVDG